MSTSTAFAYETVVVACDECGAPRPLGEAGGHGSCVYCGNEAAHTAAPREVPRAHAVAEPERLAALAAQDVGSPALPTDLEALFVGPDLVPWKVSDALARYAGARAALRAGPAPGAELRLHRLATALAGHFARAGDAVRERCLLEGALSVAREAKHRQALAAALARGACRVGDLAAGRRWLEACDPRPLDLEADTAFRFASAYLAAAEGRPDRVLESLPEGIALADVHEPECVVLRAHAFEQLGHVDRAVATLEELSVRAGALGRCLLARFVEQHAGRLCVRSAPMAAERARRRGVALAGKRAGAPMIVLAIALACSSVLAVATAIVYLLAGLGWAVYAVGLGGLFPVVMSVIAAADLRSYARLRRLRRDGATALARVLDVRSTLTATRGVPEVRYRVLVLPYMAAPFEAHAIFHADRAVRARCAPGALVVVRVLSDDPRAVAIEVD